MFLIFTLTQARSEFVGHGLGHLVDVHWRDVCGKKKLLGNDNSNNGVDNGDESKGEKTEESDTNNNAVNDQQSDNNSKDEEEEENDDGKGGFQLPQATAHAIFLDLPEPWLAVPHAAYTIKPTGRICSYSPCMEQTQRTVAALRRHGFHSLRTVEARLKEYFVDEVELEDVPKDLPMIPTEETASLEKERCVGGADAQQGVGDGGKNDDGKEIDANSKKRKKVGLTSSVNASSNKLLCARPFPQMRGHTAFLTFATAGNSPRPDPNA